MEETRRKFLEKEGLLNPKPARVSYQLFKTIDFFEPLDLPQVRYEMLRIARIEGFSVAEACRLFGFSREYFYKLERIFMTRGFISLLGSSMGRRPLIALNQELINFILHRKIEEPRVSCEKICLQIKKLYQVDCSCRTIERIVEKFGLGKRG